MPFDHEQPAVAELPIEAIHIGDRFRRELGDIASLAASIDEVGLLHPIVVTPDHRLIAGERRLLAMRKLGRTHVPVRIVPIDDIVRGEFAENVSRKDFAPSEMVAIGRAVEPLLRAQAKERQGHAPTNIPESCRKVQMATSATTSPATATSPGVHTRRRRRSSSRPSASPTAMARWSSVWIGRARSAACIASSSSRKKPK